MGTSDTRPKSKAAAPREIVRRKPRPAAASRLSGEGVVQFYVQGHAASSTVMKFTPSKLVEVLQVGLPFGELQDLQTRLAVVSERLAPMLGISKATFHRRKGDSRKLSPAVSDRVVRYARLLGFALKVFGNLGDAKQWLNAPQFGLGGAVPLEYAKTEIGAREVENLLGRIEYGVYS
jgi:putative toxin-antitoxin system antitoxin component (TIGR02293 family)